ncbi:NAD(P)/FAD-dependent oxidoreductase [Rufibacter immobilis]|uniref:NAD(P)/FAD-dependent oxidoreductase n=1 Tax=Rufibacter immobilis TaxID=1348778 RepID=UPI0035E4C5C8
MQERTTFDVIIIGGSYAGLSAAMCLGRALRQVLVLDMGQPCNRQTPHSHNFLTQDGETPAAIAQKARAQVQAYPNVSFRNDAALQVTGQNCDFTVTTASSSILKASKLIFATGIRDLMPPIKGFSECWGISVLHCPYCHGYEVSGKEFGILANGEMAFELVKLLQNWSMKLTLLTNGPNKLTPEQERQLQHYQVAVEEKEVAEFVHEQGQLQQVTFQDGSTRNLTTVFARLPFEQHCPLPQALGCALAASGHLQVDAFQRTTVPGIYAAGDAISKLRGVSAAVAQGTAAGAFVNKDLIDERF